MKKENMKWGEIVAQSYRNNIEVFAGVDAQRGRVLLLTCTGDEPYRGMTDGITLGLYFRRLTRRGQIALIRRMSDHGDGPTL